MLAPARIWSGEGKAMDHIIMANFHYCGCASFMVLHSHSNSVYSKGRKLTGMKLVKVCIDTDPLLSVNMS